MKNVFLSFSFIFLFSIAARTQSVSTDENQLALRGYDVVNYFTTNTAARGSVEFSAEHKGATYYFSSAKNRASFMANPQHIFRSMVVIVPLRWLK